MAPDLCEQDVPFGGEVASDQANTKLTEHRYGTYLLRTDVPFRLKSHPIETK
jgi:hypothetical protein